MMSDPLETFSPPVRSWFRQAFGAPTPPQAQGWPPVQRGEHTLILAPTGSGKTIAAFLWGIDQLFRESLAAGRSPEPGVVLLYVSPLKALNNDIERNLRVPLRGIRETAAQMGQELPELRVAVRTGDTPAAARNAMVRRPPHILITTPESLYLILTSARARAMFRTVRTVIVDEIHTLAGNKRGVHLALSLERLEHLVQARVQRIGLSATIRPLDQVARFLGGQEPAAAGAKAGKENELVPRPVTVVNATYHKSLDLRVVTVVPDFRDLSTSSIWPQIIPRVLQDIREHRSTLIFANNRRLAERTADRLNAQLTAEQSEEIPPGSTEVLAPGGLASDRGIFAIGAEGPIRAHHGSMSRAARRQMEEDLKAGHLPALVGTSSLELGIDIGAVDLVVQLQSPKSVAQGLQRVGRSGHLVGETSVGRIYPTFREDLVEAAAIARGMLEGDVEPTFTPQNPLDVLAQQIVAMVAAENWSVLDLYYLVRQAFPYRDLSLPAFYAVLEMLAGKYGGVSQRELRARIAWDRVNNILTALPGSRLLAITNPGTIADTGAFNVVLEDRKTRVGELDEEFVHETRVGDAFLLGSKVWRVLEIADDRIVVGDASGAVPRMPFWNGDYPWRPYELGARIGRFRREIAEKIASHPGELEELELQLSEQYALDENSARNLVAHVKRQLDASGVMSSDRTIVVETFADAVGEPRMVIHSPFGGRINGAWALALTSAISQRTGVKPETQTNDDGIIFRFPQMDMELPVDIVRSMTPEDARDRILQELPDSALFGAHFRMNAARALLLPRSRGSKRTPFWLQRLKAKNLLAIVRQMDNFPIVAETYRDVLRDVLDLPHLQEVLEKIARGEIRVVHIESALPSPVASALLFQFVSIYMYEWDAPKAERQLQTLAAHKELIEDLLQGVDLASLLKPEAVQEIAQRARHIAAGYRARSAEELLLLLEETGDLTTDELLERSEKDARAWITQLEQQGRIRQVEIPTRGGEQARWIPTELAHEYADLVANGRPILQRFLRSVGFVTREAILERYAFPADWLDDALSQLVQAREIVQGHLSPSTARNDRAPIEFVDRRNLEQIHRRTLALLRKQVQPVPLFTFSDFLVRWQHAHPSTQLAGEQGARQVLEQLRGAALANVAWERDILPARLVDYSPGELDNLASEGELVWVAAGQDPRRGRVRFFFRGEGMLFLPPLQEAVLSEGARVLFEYLEAEGASFSRDIERGTGIKGDKLDDALVELVMAERVTNDSLDALRGLTRPSDSPARSPLESGLASEISARLQNPPRLTPTRYRDAKRRVAARLKTEPSASFRSTPLPGRWTLVHRPGIMGPSLPEDERGRRLARLLLARYGVITREGLEHEEQIGDWSLLYPALQLMEMRGEVRRGYFVDRLAGLQFAAPEAVEALRAAAPSSDQAIVTLNAADPANLFGSELPGVSLRFARIPSTHIVLERGQPLLLAEDGGERMTILPAAGEEEMRRALHAYITRPNAPRHLAVKQWNGAPVRGSAGEQILEALGFYRTPTGMER